MSVGGIVGDIRSKLLCLSPETLMMNSIGVWWILTLC